MKNITKSVLYALIASVTISGLLGVLAILSGGTDAMQMRILSTTSTISGASLLMLSCAALWERKKKIWLPLTGIALTLLGALNVIVVIWTDDYGEERAKFIFCIVAFAVATSHLSLLSLANLSATFRPSLIAAYFADLGLASLIAWVLLTDAKVDAVFRIAAILSIVGATLSILIPIFHRLSVASFEKGAPVLGEELMCPLCGTRLPYAAGEMKCPKCGSIFTINVMGQVSRPSGT